MPWRRNVRVVDASVFVHALAGESAVGVRARHALHDEPMAAPHLVDLEVVAALRRHCLRGLVSVLTAHRALDDLATLPITRHHHAGLLQRCWQLRDNIKTYDAAYVALAEALGVPLLTTDARLANAPGIRCEIELLT